jgi:hypothetical protein
LAELLELGIVAEELEIPEALLLGLGAGSRSRTTAAAGAGTTALLSGKVKQVNVTVIVTA